MTKQLWLQHTHPMTELRAKSGGPHPFVLRSPLDRLGFQLASRLLQIMAPNALQHRLRSHQHQYFESRV